MEAREEGGMVEARGTGAGKSPPRGVDFGRRRLGILEDLRKTLDPADHWFGIIAPEPGKVLWTRAFNET